MNQEGSIEIRLIERSNWRKDTALGCCSSVEGAREMARAWRDRTASRFWVDPVLVMDLPIIVFELRVGEDRDGMEFLSLRDLDSWMRSGSVTT